MKKARMTFLATIEDDIRDENRLYDAEEQVNVLYGILKKGTIGGKNMEIDIPYASREIIEDERVKRVDTLKFQGGGTFECFHCMQRSVVWQSDFMFEYYGYEGEGLVQNLVCMNCGAEIEYRVPLEPEE